MGQIGWLGWLIVGGLAGLFANFVMQTRMGLIADLIIGFLGALATGYLFGVSGQLGITGFNLWSIFVAFMGAVLLLSMIRLVSGNRHIAYKVDERSQRVVRQFKLALVGLVGKQTIPIVLTKRRAKQKAGSSFYSFEGVGVDQVVTVPSRVAHFGRPTKTSRSASSKTN